jgi:hypothetical protein
MAELHSVYSNVEHTVTPEDGHTQATPETHVELLHQSTHVASPSEHHAVDHSVAVETKPDHETGQHHSTAEPQHHSADQHVPHPVTPTHTPLKTDEHKTPSAEHIHHQPEPHTIPSEHKLQRPVTHEKSPPHEPKHSSVKQDHERDDDADSYEPFEDHVPRKDHKPHRQKPAQKHASPPEHLLYAHAVKYVGYA